MADDPLTSDHCVYEKDKPCLPECDWQQDDDKEGPIPRCLREIQARPRGFERTIEDVLREQRHEHPPASLASNQQCPTCQQWLSETRESDELLQHLRAQPPIIGSQPSTRPCWHEELRRARDDVTDALIDVWYCPKPNCDFEIDRTADGDSA